MSDCSINVAGTKIQDIRRAALTEWLSILFPEKKLTVSALAGDASFRRYFRACVDDKTFVVMDAPPEKENCDAFVAIATAFQSASVRFPEIIAADYEQGFLLLSDFGDRQLLPLLTQHSVDELYGSAMDVLFQMQQSNFALPNFDDVLYWREFDIFHTWYIQKNKGITLSSDDETQLRNAYQLLIDSAHAQPQVFVHRDYHSRNIMQCDDGGLGILDFQDAVRGPVTYDLVSLLRDCYIAWPVAQTEKWVADFYAKLSLSVDFKTFLRWFDLMGLQRHIKCLGIFSRLYYRDHKEGYLKEIPRVLDYALFVCDRYPELSSLKVILQRT